MNIDKILRCFPKQIQELIRENQLQKTQLIQYIERNKQLEERNKNLQQTNKTLNKKNERNERNIKLIIIKRITTKDSRITSKDSRFGFRNII